MSSMKPEPNPLPETRPTTGRDYWRSLEEYAQTPEFQDMVHREFPSMAPDVVSDTSRREFLKIMGASLGMAGLTGCMWPQEKILPFAERPEGRMPGIPVFYATGMELSGVARGLLAKSFDGRPVKIEGNPQHPESQGSSDVVSQSVILEMYDPDRSRNVVEAQGAQTFQRTWTEFAAAAGKALNGQRGRGAGLAVLSETTSSPTMAALRAQWMQAFPESDWVEWEAVDRDNERAGSRAAFGSVLRPHYHFNRADVVASFDEDFLVSHPASVKYAFDFVEGRQAPGGHGGHGASGHDSGHDSHGHAANDGHGNDHAHGGADMRKGSFNRLYAVEPCYSPTGGMADHRLPVAPSEVSTVLGELAAELFLGSGLTHPSLDGALRSRLQAFRQGGKHAAFVKQMAADLMAHRGASVIAVGARQPASAHALGHLINAALGNIGQTVHFAADPSGDRPSYMSALTGLAGKMKAGRVRTVLILGGNPVFDAPGDLGMADALSNVETRIHLSLHENETSMACNWRLPRAHFLEAWGDSRAWDGTITITQPLIRPLYDGRSATEVVSALLNGVETRGYDLLRAQMGGSEERWRAALHDGLVAGSGFAMQTPSVGGAGLSAVLSNLSPREASASNGELEISFAPDPAIYDGRFANNGWLQELPDLLTKLTWGNALLLGVSTANAMGLSDGDVVALETDGRKIEVPIWTTPGQAPHSGHLYCGYGRTSAGQVGTEVGVDVYPLRGSSAWHQASGVKITKVGRTEELVSTQDHFAIDDAGQKATASRLGALVQEATVEEFSHGHGHDDHGHHPPALPLWDPHEYDGNRWALTIDLNSCTGCNACVVACQSENNIPVVGKAEVAMGREMHWIRVDRYFRGDPEDPALVLQPVSCQQCENAPCEQVCPVAATVHSSEGLNDMVYNRCIGTRYCANNCPYKVRRFNFFNYNGGMESVEKMRANPDVTMRARGVMEKCTFCTQRISQVKIQAKNERRPIEDGEIRTACEQACPTRAITFGNLNDPNSRVRKLQDDDRSYAMLDGHLHTKPRLKYMKKLRNPAAGLAGSSGDHGHDGHHG